MNECPQRCSSLQPRSRFGADTENNKRLPERPAVIHNSFLIIFEGTGPSGQILPPGFPLFLRRSLRCALLKSSCTCIKKKLFIHRCTLKQKIHSNTDKLHPKGVLTLTSHFFLHCHVHAEPPLSVHCGYARANSRGER